MVKHLKYTEAERILKIYKSYKPEKFFPKVKDFRLKQYRSYIDFEHIKGSILNKKEIPEAFYTLGKMHRKHALKQNGLNIYTLCHGDFHPKNIIKTYQGYRFIDVTFAHIGWNYTDFDYVDFFGFFDPENYPWIIKDNRILENYLEGAGLNASPGEKNIFRRKAAAYALKKYIRNGIKNNINISHEKKLLVKLNNKNI